MGSHIVCSTNIAGFPYLEVTFLPLYTFNNHLNRGWGELQPISTSVTPCASPSNIMCFSSRSPANSIHSSKALASNSKAPNGRSNLLLIAPMISPLSFLITIPIPQLPNPLNTALSTFTLYHPSLGGVHLPILGGAGCFGAPNCPLNSSTEALASVTILVTSLHFPSNFAAFLFFQMHHTVHVKRSSSPSFQSSQSFHTTSMKSR